MANPENNHQIEKERYIIGKLMSMAAKSLNPDSYTDLERIIAELKSARNLDG